MTRLLVPTVAVLFTCVLAAPVAAEEPPGLAERVERIGKLPADLIKAKKTDAEIVESLVLAAMHRLPTDKEKEAGTKHLAAGKDREEASRDLAWALINTKEFLKLNGLEKDIPAALEFLNAQSAKWGKKDSEKEKQ